MSPIVVNEIGTSGQISEAADRKVDHPSKSFGGAISNAKFLQMSGDNGVLDKHVNLGDCAQVSGKAYQ